MAPSFQKFIDDLCKSRLITSDEVDRFLESFPRELRPTTVQALARELIRFNKLTKFQASRIYRGRTRGLVLGNYTVLDRIGRGGMGDVFKARHRRMKREVALKVLAGSVTKSRRARRRFQREVETAAKLVHPHIVTAFDANEDQGLHYLVMEFVDGEDLGVMVDRDGPLAVPKTLDCLIQAAQGLEFAHAQGVIHRDIKPHNLLLSAAGVVKVLDMGLVFLQTDDPQEGDGLTKENHVVGTVDYMSPEQAEDINRVDHRADIYSLGCTLFRLVVGTTPYVADTPIKKLLAHRERPVPSLREHRPDVSPELDAVFQKMMAKKPAQRQQSMSEVIEDLKKCRQAASASIAVSPGAHSSLPVATLLPEPSDPASRSNVLADDEAGIMISDSDLAGASAAPPSSEQTDESDSAVLRFITALEQDPNAISSTQLGAEVTVDATAEQSTVSSGSSIQKTHHHLRRKRRADQRRFFLTVISFGVVLGLLLLIAWYWSRPTQIALDWPVIDRFGATVLIDSKPVTLGQTDLVFVPVDPGQHTIVIQRHGFESQEFEVDLSRGDTVNLPLDWESTKD